MPLASQTSFDRRDQGREFDELAYVRHGLSPDSGEILGPSWKDLLLILVAADSVRNQNLRVQGEALKKLAWRGRSSTRA